MRPSSLLTLALAAQLGAACGGGGEPAPALPQPGPVFDLRADRPALSLLTPVITGELAQPSIDLSQEPVEEARSSRAVALPELPAHSATARVRVAVNLDLSADAPAREHFHPRDPYSYSHKMSLSAFDAGGAPYALELYFARTLDGYAWYGVVDEHAFPAVIASGELGFDPLGRLREEREDQGGAPSFDFGDATAAGGTGRLGSTAYAEGFYVRGVWLD